MRRPDKVSKVFVLISLWIVSFLQISNVLGVTFVDLVSFEPVFQRGMSYRPAPYPNYYSYDTSESDESLRRMAEDNVKYVAIIPWWFQENLTSAQIYPHSDFTPTNESLKHAIQKAHELDMKVMLKPVVDTEDARNEPRWKINGTEEWFQSYRVFISSYAQLAEENDVDLLCIGCEFKYTEANQSNWEQIISEVRELYTGPITYAALIDSYRSIAWWDSLDYVGIDAYFPLTEVNDPTLEELKQAWNHWANEIESWHSTTKKPILFTEIGYRSGDGNNKQPWNWTETLEPDLQEQFDCYLAAFQTLWGKPWFYGFYWWIWESNPNAGGLNDTDFTPQNKPVEYLIKSWYSSDPAQDLISYLEDRIGFLENRVDDLQAQNQMLQQELEDVQQKYNKLLNNYEVNKYLLYTFVATTVFFVTTTVFYVRRGRTKHQ